jgi:hypothetical protein
MQLMPHTIDKIYIKCHRSLKSQGKEDIEYNYSDVGVEKDGGANLPNSTVRSKFLGKKEGPKATYGHGKDTMDSLLNMKDEGIHVII